MVRLHGATITGRLRHDPGLLLLIGLVVAVTTVLAAAVAPLAERTSDRAMAASVTDAGVRGAVVATMPRGYDDPQGTQRDPRSAVELAQDADYALHTLPDRLAGVLRAGETTLTTPPLHLLDAGPNRFLRLTYLDSPHGAPRVRWTAGEPPRASVGDDRAALTVPSGGDPWPVQVGLSEAAAEALGLGPGDRLLAEDEQARRVAVQVSGTYVAADPGDQAWTGTPGLLHPSTGVSETGPSVAAAGLVTADSLPDLRVAVPADDLTHRVVFTPRPEQTRWRDSSAVSREVVSLKASAGLARGDISWDGQLDQVLDAGRAQVASARGQAQVLLIGLLACALLVLVLAAQLLVQRRGGALAMARERGASLVGLGAELLVESVLVAAVGAALGITVTVVVVGAAGWAWALPVVVAAALAAPILGAVAAARATGRRVPANRAARRTAARARRVRRVAVEVAVLAAAALSFVALRQRGVVGGAESDGDLTAASAATWWAVAGTLVLLRLVPPAARLALRATRRSRGGGVFFVAARLAQTGARALPLLVVSVAVAQLTLGVALAATEQAGQAAGARLAVGGDARLSTAPDPDVAASARTVARAPGVRAAVSGRVADGVQASSRLSAGTVRLVVVDATAYRRLLAAAGLPDAPGLARLDTAGTDDRLPALALGVDPALRDGLVLRWDDGAIPVEVVGSAPRVDAVSGPVVVVDADAFAGTGAVADPDTLWAVGPGAAAALEATAGDGSVVRYTEVLDQRRRAPLASGLVRLAIASSALLLLFALLGLALSAAAEAPARGESLGRLRSLGLGDRAVRRLLYGELAAPVLIAAVVGLALGLTCAVAVFGSLSLPLVTGQTGQPHLVVPWWLLLVVAALAAGVLAVAAAEWRRLRRRPLAELLRS